jgi:hypothetical protein
MRRFFAWLVRPQCTALAVAAAFLLGNLGALHLAWWGQIVGAASIGVAYGTLSALLPRLLHRKAHR